MNREKKLIFNIITFFIVFGFIINSNSILNVHAEDEIDDNEIENDEDKDEIDDDLELLNQRQIQIEFDTEEIQIQTHRENIEIKDELNFVLKISEQGLEIQSEYQQENGIHTQFKIIFEQFYEYSDQNGNLIYDSGDSLYNTISFDDLSSFTHQKSTLNNSEIYHIQTSTKDHKHIFHIFISTDFNYINQSRLTPNQIKIDYELSNFTPLNINSRYALDISYLSEDEGKFEEETEDENEGFASQEQWLKLSDTNISSYFSWSTIAQVDSTIANVTINQNISEGSNNQKIYLNYPSGSNIYHDPKIGIKGILIKPSSTSTTVTPPTPINPNNQNFWIWILIGIIFFSIGLMMSKAEYRDYLLNRVLHFDTGAHRLTMEEVLENEIRIKVLNLIIDYPGIHYNELLRQSEISPNTLAWHLDILETYKIIHKQRVGQLLIFYPYLDKNPFAEFDPTISKSKFTLDIFQIIGDNPGIHQKSIVTRMESNRKTVDYHLKKLIDADLIQTEKKGKNILYYTKIKEIQIPTQFIDKI